MGSIMLNWPEARDENPLVTGVVEASSFRETIGLNQNCSPSGHIKISSRRCALSGQADLKTVAGSSTRISRSSIFSHFA